MTALDLDAIRERLTVNRLGLSWAREADKDLVVIRALLAEVERLGADEPRYKATIRFLETQQKIMHAEKDHGWRLADRYEAERDELAAEVAHLTAQRDAVLALHRPVEVEPSGTICHGCSTLRGSGDNLRYFPAVEYPCATVRALTPTPKETL